MSFCRHQHPFFDKDSVANDPVAPSPGGLLYYDYVNKVDLLLMSFSTHFLERLLQIQ